MNLSVVIPAYNEKENIIITIKELLVSVKTISYVNDVQIIVVDDHSTDRTYEAVGKIDDSRIICLRLSKRSGSHTALRAGLKESGGDAVLCISADGQDDPSCLKEMLDKWRRGEAKVVWALRERRDNETWYYRLLARTYYLILNFLYQRKDDAINQAYADFFLLDRNVINAVGACSERNTHLFGLIEWLGFAQDFVKYRRRKRRCGKPKWSYRGRLDVGARWIIAFSGLPLRLMIFVGFITALLGFLYAIFLVIRTFVAYPAPGWSSIMVAILVLGGIQMLMLGIIGEYLWSNLEESRKRPLYLIEKRTKNPSK